MSRELRAGILKAVTVVQYHVRCPKCGESLVFGRLTEEVELKPAPIITTVRPQTAPKAYLPGQHGKLHRIRGLDLKILQFAKHAGKILTYDEICKAFKVQYGVSYITTTRYITKLVERKELIRLSKGTVVAGQWTHSRKGETKTS